MEEGGYSPQVHSAIHSDYNSGGSWKYLVGQAASVEVDIEVLPDQSLHTNDFVTLS